MSPVSVYVIAIRDGAEIRSPVKIGVSNNPRARLDAFQTSCPLDLVLFKTFALPNREVAFSVEECFHATQRGRQRRGEWFDIQPSEAAAILAVQISWLLDAFTDLSHDEKIIAMKLAEGRA